MLPRPWMLVPASPPVDLVAVAALSTRRKNPPDQLKRDGGDAESTRIYLAQRS